MPKNHFNSHFKNGYKLYQETAYRYHIDLPAKQFVSWDASKLLWMIFVILVVIGIIFFTSGVTILHG
jgi:acyl-coenzyme A synthetase/AMP-(fatty) acid ligase